MSSREGDRVIGESRFLLQQLSFSVLINLRQHSATLLSVINRIFEVRSARAVQRLGVSRIGAIGEVAVLCDSCAS